MGQLEYVRNNWKEILGEDFFMLLTTIDILKEEHKFHLPGPGPSQEYEFGFAEDEPEQFSEDLDWMPKVVMIAKSTYVWLDQLSKNMDGKYIFSIKFQTKNCICFIAGVSLLCG